MVLCLCKYMYMKIITEFYILSFIMSKYSQANEMFTKKSVTFVRVKLKVIFSKFCVLYFKLHIVDFFLFVCFVLCVFNILDDDS